MLGVKKSAFTRGGKGRARKYTLYPMDVPMKAFRSGENRKILLRHPLSFAIFGGGGAGEGNRSRFQKEEGHGYVRDGVDEGENGNSVGNDRQSFEKVAEKEACA